MLSIYLITNKLNNKVYVGQTVQPIQLRWSAHKSRARNGDNRPLYCSIRKHGAESFTIELLETVLSQQEADQTEKRWIATLNTTDRSIGYNLKEGGNSSRHSPESKDKIRLAHLGKKKSDEHRANIGKGHRKFTDDEELSIVNDKRSSRELAKAMGVAHGTILRIRRKYQTQDHQ